MYFSRNLPFGQIEKEIYRALFLSLNPEVANQRHLLDLGRDRIRQSPPKQTKQLSDKNIK